MGVEIKTSTRRRNEIRDDSILGRLEIQYHDITKVDFWDGNDFGTDKICPNRPKIKSVPQKLLLRYLVFAGVFERIPGNTGDRMYQIFAPNVLKDEITRPLSTC